ncbi:MAG: hypothetical protein CL920_36275 [Deltaproteobacteria bacterium]|nr:hypothetical protein [Deltaproteobacteria bacterium]MBU54186.1 hypothetical protein [Deltaproteobacteria bacterium]
MRPFYLLKACILEDKWYNMQSLPVSKPSHHRQNATLKQKVDWMTRAKKRFLLNELKTLFCFVLDVLQKNEGIFAQACDFFITVLPNEDGR